MSHADNLVELLTYIEEVEKLKRTPAYSVPPEFFVLQAAEVSGLPGIELDISDNQGNPVWLKLSRMHEMPAPELPDVLRSWVKVSRDPEKLPSMRDSLELELDGEVTQQLAGDVPGLNDAFKAYVSGPWQAWSEEEAPRRKSIALYNRLFSLQQTLSADGTDNPLELAWGLVQAFWAVPGAGKPVAHPLLTQGCEVRLDERTYSLEVAPREVDPRLELDCYAELGVPGTVALELSAREALSSLAEGVSPFEPTTFEAVAHAAVAHLCPTGVYLPEGKPCAPTDQLQVVGAWVLFARKRAGDIFVEDVLRLKQAVSSGAMQIPDVLQDFVREGSSSLVEAPTVQFRGLASSVEGADVRELYFPLPYNEEQVSIIRKLETSNGVVVQGPPGTGKTHSIANVVSHFLAQGKRVLVTSKGDTALSVLQEKLPERIRPLSVALLSDERDGMKQFEHSIGRIASEVSSLRPEAIQATLEALEGEIQDCHARISAVDQAIARDAAKHLSKYPLDGQLVSAVELAQSVVDKAKAYQWFTDDLPEGAEPVLTVEEVSELRAARRMVGRDLDYVGVTVPRRAELPSWEVLAKLHKDIVRSREIEEQVATGQVLPLKDSTLETFKKAQELADTLQRYKSLVGSLSEYPQGAAFLAQVRQLRGDDALLGPLAALTQRVSALEAKRKDFIVQAIEIPEGVEKDEDFMGALQRLSAGKSAFALPFGKSAARQLMAEVRVAGEKPSTASAWQAVGLLVAWRVEVAQALAVYRSLAPELSLPTEGLDLKKASQALQYISLAREVVFEFERKLGSAVSAVFGHSVANAQGAHLQEAIESFSASLMVHLDKGLLSYALEQLNEIRRVLDGNSGAVTAQLKEMLTEHIGSLEPESELRLAWLALLDELDRLAGLEGSLGVVSALASKVEKAGAPAWANRLLREAALADFDPALPLDWAQAWQWRQNFLLLERMDVHSHLRAKFAERTELTDRLARAYQNLVAERTWLGVLQNSPPAIRQALQAYLNSVQAMGAGTGVKAMRHRKNAREAMARAYRAVPCWVLPHWRVSETLPAELGLFDLVIIDEASQSDIWALPALMRGKKLLVVGDHKQVSPLTVGMAEQKIVDIQKRFLEAQPHGRYMTPDASIYDLARVIFAGNSVMLKEHFRCVSAIIEYSNREFYEGEIKALRVPSATERLDPPLVDVYVKGGYRKGDANPPEAEAIVQQIQAILEDDDLAGRTIGVVTLLGTAQAKLIHDMVHSRIPTEVIVTRKITVGPPPFFQGRERDIMLVSMVLQQGDRTAANVLAQQQRFNVALSRARDRVYLFRSVTADAFSPDSLTGRLLRHFRQPFNQSDEAKAAGRERCESGFERDVYDELAQRGYRVRPQVPCGQFRIDMVVEGADGKRLAVECDGDLYHGPGKWADDMARQRVLERAGWTFWRCFASSFVRRRKEVVEDLIETLDAMGITPMADEDSDDSLVATHVVDPLQLEKPVQPAQRRVDVSDLRSWLDDQLAKP